MGKGILDIPGLLSIEEAAEALGVTVMTIWRKIKRGDIIPLDVGGRTLIAQSEIQRNQNDKADGPGPSA